MKKSSVYRLMLYNTLHFVAVICAVSCINKENEFNNFIFETGYAKSDTIDFNLVDHLNASNKKIIQLSSIASNQTKDAKMLGLLLKIKRDYQKMDFEFKKLAEKNLIVLPKLAFDFNLIPDSLKGKNSCDHLSKALENEIENQVPLWDKMQNKDQNIDFRTFATKSKKTVLANWEMLKKTLNTPQKKQFNLTEEKTIKNKEV